MRGSRVKKLRAEFIKKHGAAPLKATWSRTPEGPALNGDEFRAWKKTRGKQS
jgi:hypothetical protein